MDPQSQPPQPIDRRHPLDWQKMLNTSWPTLCLAAAVGGWDHTGDNISACTREEYDAAIAAAQAKLAEARLKSGVAEKHVVVLPHSGLLHAVIVKRPLGAELRAFVTTMASDTTPDAQKQDYAADYFARHCLWPVEGMQERQDLMEVLPGAFFYDYPQGMQRLVGFSGGEVRKRA